MNEELGGRPSVYIENYFPFPTALLNEQVQAETGATPFNSVHRWFSRKPLSFSRASVLASILPATLTPGDFRRLLGVPKDIPKDFRLYKQTPSVDMITEVKNLSTSLWGEDVRVLDAFAGGGSIPFEALRYHMKTLAFVLNALFLSLLLLTGGLITLHHQERRGVLSLYVFLYQTKQVGISALLRWYTGQSKMAT